MHSLLARYLEKVGIKKVIELAPEERVTFENWQRILSANEEVTVDKLAEFCRGQLASVEQQMSNLDNKSAKNDRLVLLHSVYKALLGAMESPMKQRESLEKYLTGLLNAP